MDPLEALAQWSDALAFPAPAWGAARLWAFPPTFHPLLPERHHLVELPLNQPIHFLLIQPVAAREGLLDAGEGAQDHHLREQTTHWDWFATLSSLLSPMFRVIYIRNFKECTFFPLLVSF